MKRTLLAALATAALLLPGAASAQFYDLDGVYRCLTAPDPACQQEQRTQPPPTPRPAPTPTLEQVIAKARNRTAGPGDIAILEKQAGAGEPRAVEVLAWCKLNGIGMPADAMAAYWLYRQAATLGVANARRNQIAVYESRLTPEQRHQVLLRENTK